MKINWMLLVPCLTSCLSWTWLFLLAGAVPAHTSAAHWTQSAPALEKKKSLLSHPYMFLFTKTRFKSIIYVNQLNSLTSLSNLCGFIKPNHVFSVWEFYWVY